MRIAKTEARKRFSEVLSRAGYQGERVKITHYGRTLATIVPNADIRKLEDCEREEAASLSRDGRGRRSPSPPRDRGGRRQGASNTRR